MTEYIENRVYDDIEIGDVACIEKVLTKRDIQLFAVMSGDINPAHLDEAFAKEDMFHDIIGHGMWSAALISSVLGTKLPGPGTIYLDQSLTFLRPVKVGDTISVSVRVKDKPNPEKHHLILSCRCTNQHGKEVVKGEACVIAPTTNIKRPRVVLPDIEIKDNEWRFYQEIIAQKDSLAPLRTAIVHPVDANSLGGAIEAAKDKLIEPILVGPKHRIEQVAQSLGIDLSPYTLIDTKHSHESAAISVKLARTGDAEALMKGHIHTDELMDAVVDKTHGLRTSRRMSHVSVLNVPNYHKPLFLTDAAINIRPNLAQKKDIVQNAVDLFLALDRGTPKVAIVSAIETVNETIPSTLDATALCKMAERGQITGALVDGPLAFDNAISMEAAKVKGIVSAVAGDADIIVVPDIESGNMLFKQMRYLSKVEAAGVVMGAQVPIILTSRAAGAGQTRLASCALALLFNRKQAIALNNPGKEG